MKPQPRTRKNITGTILIAILLAVAVLPGVALAVPPEIPSNNNTNTSPPGGGNNNTTSPPPVGGGNNNTLPPGGGNNTNTNTPPSLDGTPGTPSNTTTPPGGGSNDGGGSQQTSSPAHPDAPSTPSNGCIVAHAATPAQLCPIANGLQYYFIGADGSSSIGPFISPFSDLATLYTGSTDVLLYSGVNPMTSKSVNIYYLPSDYVLRVSTYYPDTQYDTDKPYIFTVNGSNTVSHTAW